MMHRGFGHFHGGWRRGPWMGRGFGFPMRHGWGFPRPWVHRHDHRPCCCLFFALPIFFLPFLALTAWIVHTL